MKKSYLVVLGLIIISSLSLAGCNSTPTPEENQPTQQVDTSPRLLQKISNESNLNTFEAAIKTAQLTDFLSKDNFYTIFAPSDEAFKQIDGSLLTKPEEVKKILMGHMMRGKVDFGDLSSIPNIQTLSGTTLTIEKNQGLTINGAKIINSLKTPDGVIHVIDKVIVTP